MFLPELRLIVARWAWVEPGLPGWSMQWLPVLWTWVFCFVLSVLSIGSPVTQAGLELVMKLKMTLSS